MNEADYVASRGGLKDPFFMPGRDMGSRQVFEASRLNHLDEVEVLDPCPNCGEMALWQSSRLNGLHRIVCTAC